MNQQRHCHSPIRYLLLEEHSLRINESTDEA